MSTFAIGDVQGCRDELVSLLEAIRFDASRDQVIFVGDLVNRGPDSLGVLRLVKSLGSAAVTVLGNHDLHLLAVAHGGNPGRRDTLNDVLGAPDREDLLEWLAHQNLAWRHPGTGTLLIHAGLAPQWSADEALTLAAEACASIAGPRRRQFLDHMYGDSPDVWNTQLRGVDRTRFVVNCLTRARYFAADGKLDLRHKGAPGTQPSDLTPWFQVSNRASRATSIAFGHWSTLGRLHWEQEQVFGLDTGCVWGGRLTALELETGAITQVPGLRPQANVVGFE